MRFPLKSLALAAVFLVMTGVSASAEPYVWRDPDTHMTMSFPDTWKRISNQQPDDVLTIAAPGDGEGAICRMRVRADRRFVIYPREYADEIQRTNYSRPFWEGYVGEYAGAEINGVWDNAGLGDGFASFADVSFISASGPKMQKRGLVFATVYNDKVYITECSAEAGAFEHWYEPFLSVVKSVDFQDGYHTNLHGWYRDFMKDPVIRIRGRKDVDLYTY